MMHMESTICLKILCKSYNLKKNIFLFELFSKEKPQNQMKDQLTQIQSEKTEKQINKNSTNSNIDFCCITSTKKGFIVGGTKGCLSFYDLGIVNLKT